MFTALARPGSHPACNPAFAWVLGMLLVPGLAFAQAAAPDYLRDFIYPRDGASPQDDIHILYADACGRPHPDPTRPAEVEFGDDLINVDIYLVEPELPVCLAVVLPDRLVAYPIGKLARGTHYVRRRLHVREVNGDAHRLVLESHDGITIGDAPNPAVSGTWFDPQAPGAGAVVNLIPATADNAAPAILFVATRLANGSPEWLSGLGTFVDGALSVPLRLSTTAAGNPPDATAVFRYLGCGESTLSVSGLDLVFPRGNALLEQLTGTAGLPGCRPPALRPPDLD